MKTERGIRKYIIRNFDKWCTQNRAIYTGDYVEGVLLDNFIMSTKRGYCAFYESYVNPNMSEYRIEFAPYKDLKAVDELFSRFITFEEKMNEYKGEEK